MRKPGVVKIQENVPADFSFEGERFAYFEAVPTETTLYRVSCAGYSGENFHSSKKVHILGIPENKEFVLLEAGKSYIICTENSEDADEAETNRILLQRILINQKAKLNQEVTYEDSSAQYEHLTEFTPEKSGKYTASATFYTYSIQNYLEVYTPSAENNLDCSTSDKWKKAAVTEPTCTEWGYTTYTCTVCGKTYKGNMKAPLGHDFGKWYMEKEPTCTEYGLMRRDCSRCEHHETQLVAPLGHEWNAPTYQWNADHTICVAKRICKRDNTHAESVMADITQKIIKPATCTERGVTEYTATFAADWAAEQKETVQDISLAGHSYQTTVTEPTCTEWGYTTYTCTVCGKTFKDNLTAPLGHDYGKWYIEIEPTCTGYGMMRRDCSRCDHYETQLIAPLGREWNEPTYEWNGDHTFCVAKRVCKHDSSHTESAVAVATEKVAEPATCTEKGKTAYTAAFTEAWAETQTVILENIDALGHDWNEPTYEWNEDHTACTAKRACRRDENRVETARAEITAEQTKAPNVGVPGEMTYTAKFSVDWAEAQTEITEIPALERPEYPEIDASEKFDDVPKAAWYTADVSSAISRGLFGGTGGDSFEPESPMTRAMLVTVLWRYADKPKAAESAFTDIDRSPASRMKTRSAKTGRLCLCSGQRRKD